jgi:hypothetical protein
MGDVRTKDMVGTAQMRLCPYMGGYPPSDVAMDGD